MHLIWLDLSRTYSNPTIPLTYNFANTIATGRSTTASAASFGSAAIGSEMSWDIAASVTFERVETTRQLAKSARRRSRRVR